MPDSNPSAPSPPSSEIDNDWSESLPSNNLKLELAPFRLEHLHDDAPGGHHPVHLGDLIGDTRRYRVMHKLGTGGFANVWLCRDLAVHDTTKYVALKILMAELSTDDCGELLVHGIL